MNILPKIKKSNSPADEKVMAMIEEIEIKGEVFHDEARIRMRRLEHQVEAARHALNVAKHEIKEDIDYVMKKVNRAADAIVLDDTDDEDDAEYGDK